MKEQRCIPGTYYKARTNRCSMTSDFPSNLVNTGSLDDDSFKPVITNCEIFELVGRGGMARVYRGRQILLDREVAVKVLLSRFDGDHVQQQQRFLREAQLSTKLKHPNICRIVFFGMDESYAMPFIIFEYLNAVTLSQHVASQGPLSWETCLQVFDEICDALAYAHSEGIIHRDLKPGNVMLVPKPDANAFTAKILDFGIAKLIGDEKFTASMQQITKTGALLGSPDYMSPEQCSGAKTDERSDIYALGCMLYFACSGKPPFTGDSAYETMSSHVHNTIPDLCTTYGVPRQVDFVIKKAMAKDPDHRYQDVASLREALQRVDPRDWRKSSAERKRAPKLSSRSMVLSAVLLAVLLLCFVRAQSDLAQKRADDAIDAVLAKMEVRMHEEKFRDVLQTLESIEIENLSDKGALRLVNYYLELSGVAQLLSNQEQIPSLARTALHIARKNHLDSAAAQCQFILAKYSDAHGSSSDAAAKQWAPGSSLRHLILGAEHVHMALIQVKKYQPRQETEGSFNQALQELQLANSPDNLLDAYAAYIDYERALNDRPKVRALLAECQKVVSLIKVDRTVSVLALLALTDGYQYVGDTKRCIQVARLANDMTLRLNSLPMLRARALKAIALAQESDGNLSVAWAALREIPDLRGLHDPALKAAAFNDLACSLLRAKKFDQALVEIEQARQLIDRHLRRERTTPSMRWQLYSLKTQTAMANLTALFNLGRAKEYMEFNKRVSREHLVMFEELKQSLDSDPDDGAKRWPIYDVVAFNSANSLLTSSGPKEADGFMTSAVKFAEDHLASSRFLVSLLAHQGLFRQNARISNGLIGPFEKAIALQQQIGAPETEIALFAVPLGSAYIEQGQVQKGVQLCERYLQRDQEPVFATALAPSVLRLGDVYAKCGDYAAALNVYDRYFKLVPKTFPEYKYSEPLFKMCRDVQVRAK